tara:strand:+ start:486 stop:869 length:384 start_codon:yes stop_codon:yes gene_type:complete
LKFLDNALGIHGKSLEVHSERLKILAGNIANVDTPNYKAKDVDFASVLQKLNKSDVRATHEKHFPVGELEKRTGLKFRVPFNPSDDGNTVEIGIEQAKYGEAASRYKATAQFLENRIGGIRKALRGE